MFQDPDDERTDPMLAVRPREPSPTPVSHVGASARTVAPRLGALPEGTKLVAHPARRSVMLPAVLLTAGVVVLAVLITAVLVLPNRLGAWASGPVEGAASALEPVELDLPEAETLPEDPE